MCLGKDTLPTVNLTLFASFLINSDSLVTLSGSLKVHGHNTYISQAFWVLMLLIIHINEKNVGMKNILTRFADDTRGRRVFDGTAACD